MKLEDIPEGHIAVTGGTTPRREHFMPIEDAEAQVAAMQQRSTAPKSITQTAEDYWKQRRAAVAPAPAAKAPAPTTIAAPASGSRLPDLVVATIDVAAAWKKRNSVGGAIQRLQPKAVADE